MVRKAAVEGLRPCSTKNGRLEGFRRQLEELQQVVGASDSRQDDSFPEVLRASQFATSLSSATTREEESRIKADNFFYRTKERKGKKGRRDGGPVNFFFPGPPVAVCGSTRCLTIY